MASNRSVANLMSSSDSRVTKGQNNEMAFSSTQLCFFSTTVTPSTLVPHHQQPFTQYLLLNSARIDLYQSGWFLDFDLDSFCKIGQKQDLDCVQNPLSLQTLNNL